MTLLLLIRTGNTGANVTPVAKIRTDGPSN